jgi:S1-C subfamily serine protease
MVAELAETVSPLGIHVARIRITEAVALGTTDALVVVQAKTGAADPAAQIGDTIHAINGDRITDLQDFETRVRNSYRALAPGRQMTIVFGHGGGLMEKRWRKPLEPK